MIRSFDKLQISGDGTSTSYKKRKETGTWQASVILLNPPDMTDGLPASSLELGRPE